MVHFLQQPKTLESMALKTLGDWIVSHTEKLAPSMKTLEQRYPTKAQELLSRQIEVIRNYMQYKLPGRFYDEAMSELLITLSFKFHHSLPASATSEVNVKKTVLRRMIETLFTKNVTILSIKSYDWKIFENSFYSYSHLMPGLTHLTLGSVCTDDVLRHVVKNFKNIQTLDVSDSEINDDSIDIMIRLSHLRTVDVLSTKVCEKGVETLLTSCPNIEYIKSDVEIEHVLERIVQREKDYGRRFNLKSYRTMGKGTFEERTLVVKMCPLIEKVIFNMYTNPSYRNPENDLSTIRDMHRLRELEIYTYCRFYLYRVKELLQVRGSNLVFLHLHRTYQIDLSALMHICVLCPNLQRLDLYRCGYRDKETAIENEEIWCNREIPPLIHLTKLSVTGSYEETYLSCIERHLIFLLSICPNIEYIDIREVVIPDGDNFLLEVLEKNPTKLKYLRKLRFCIPNLNLSKAAIDQIAQNCVYNPEVFRCCK